MSRYRISRGNHYADGLNFRPVFWKKSAKYTVRFTPSCLYDLGNNNQGDVNKLCGWGHFDHRANGVRFGWRCIQNKIELVGYLHVSPSLIRRGQHITYRFNPILLLDIDVDYELILSLDTSKEDHDEYFFGVLRDNAYIGRLIATRSKLSWLQKAIGTTNYFYFGGDEVAPHDIYATITEHE